MHRVIKKIVAWSPRIVLAALIVVGGVGLAARVWFAPQPSEASWILPFEGTVTEIEYNCLCSGSIMLTIEPTTASRQQGAQTKKLLFVWAAPLIKKMTGVDIPVPACYLWYYPIFTTSNAQLLGNYIPGAFPCYEYSGNFCTFKENAQGAILNVGTSLY